MVSERENWDFIDRDLRYDKRERERQTDRQTDREKREIV
jgi:hypothetical protein